MPLKACWRRHAQCLAYSQLAVAWQWLLPSSQASSFKFWTLDRGTGLQFPPLEHLTQLYMSMIACTLVLGITWRAVKAQIAAVMATEKPELVLEFMDLPTQSGSYECGLFTTALVLGEKPESELIECTNCNEWYHLDTCIDVPPTTCLDSSVPWFCHKCL